MTKLLSAIALLACLPAIGSSQVGPIQTPYPNLPNFYNRSTQPLSPYLNILRGQNSGVNYYYGVGSPQSGQIRSPLAGSPFVYQYAPFPSDSGQLQPSRGYVLPPAGHANSYGNYFGISGTGLPGYGGVRPNQSTLNPGVANTRPQANTTGNRRP
jgi:hypothetical protein